MVQEQSWGSILGDDQRYNNFCLETLFETLNANAGKVNFVDSIRPQIQTLVKESTPNIFKMGVACLQAFVQNSFTGPSITREIQERWPIIKESTNDALAALAIDGEEVYQLTSLPLLLLIAKLILIDNKHNLSDLDASWWAFRCALVHQKLLDHFSSTLQSFINKAIAETNANLPSLEDNRALHACFHLECGLVNHYYTNDAKSRQYFSEAQLCNQFKWNVTGALGKRTKYQSFDVSQLMIVAISHINADDEIGSPKLLPKNPNLNDDTLLEKIAFTQEPKQQNLNAVDQCILLAFCLNVRNTNAADGLTAEQMMPFVQRVLENPNNWMIHTMALLLRSRLESGKSRTVERSCLQLQALVDQFDCNDSEASERMMYFYLIEMPTKWDIEVFFLLSQRELGKRFVSLGVIRSALEIFTRLEMWEDVISCHQMLDQPKKAELIILNLLKTYPHSAKFTCLLGDVRHDPSLYQVAWDLSGGRFARAMRSLGAEKFRCSEWQASIDCYSKALLINPLFENSWFTMGCAALKIDQLDTAVDAFARVTSIDPDNGEAWSNQASVFIRQKKLREAYRCLKEAIRHNYDSSNIWENFMYVCVDIGEIRDAIRALDRIFSIRIEKDDRKSKAVDLEVLEIITQAVMDNISDSSGTPSSAHVKQLDAFLSATTSRMSSAQLSTICAKFYESQSRPVEALEFARKAYTCLLNDPRMLLDLLIFQQLAHTTLGFVQSLSLLGPQLTGGELTNHEAVVCKDWKYQSKMAIKAVIGRTREIYEDRKEFQNLVSVLVNYTN